MEEGQYIQHMMDRKDDRKSASQAKADWDAMEKDKKKHFNDNKGKDGALRFRVHISDKVVFRSRYSKIKETEFHGKQVKNPDAAAMDEIKAKLNSGKDAADADEFDLMARAMVSCGAGVDEQDGMFEGSFMGTNLHNIRLLADDAEAEAPEEDDEEEEVVENGEPKAKKGTKKEISRKQGGTSGRAATCRCMYESPADVESRHRQDRGLVFGVAWKWGGTIANCLQEP